VNGPAADSFKRLWGPAMPSSREASLLAAARLAGSTDPDRVIAIGRRCGSTLPDAETACHEMLAAAYRVRKLWAEEVAEIDAIVARRPGEIGEWVEYRAWALGRLGRFNDAEHMVDEVLAKEPDNFLARIGRFEVAALRGSTADALSRGDADVQRPGALPLELNHVAWYRIGVGGDLTVARDLAQKAVAAQTRDASNLNTLATIEAEMGDIDRALHDNWRVMELRGSNAPTDEDWYVVGRIDEQLGLLSDAAAIYKRVAPPDRDELLSAYDLAQRRLAAMGARP
jgi:tetratricopeptide (TPR) repeat protein